MGLRCIPLLIWRFKSSKYYLMWKIYKKPLLEVVLSTGLPLRNDGMNRSFIEVLSSLSSFQRLTLITVFVLLSILLLLPKNVPLVKNKQTSLSSVYVKSPLVGNNQVLTYFFIEYLGNNTLKLAG